MKKRTIIALIVAAVLILAGLLLAAAGIAAAGFDPDSLNRVHTEERTYVVDEPFDSIRLTATVSDVSFVKTRGDIRVVCTETEQLSYAVMAENGVLKIEAVELRDWWDYIGFFDWAELKITVYLPEDAYAQLSVQTDTGDVSIPDSFTFSSAEILSDTGDIDSAAKISMDLALCTDTGDIELRGCAPENLSVLTDTGDVALEDISTVGNIQVTTATGEIDMTRVRGKSISLESSTGDQELQDVLAENALNILSSTGEVSLLGCDATQIRIDTNTGDISGVLLTPKEFFAYTDTGDVRIASHSGTPSGQCYVNSSTGDINFSYQP